MQKKWRISGKMDRQLRMVDTSHGVLTYTLIKKRVKNLNLHLERSGQVVVSVPMRCSASYADQFVAGKAGWILAKQEQLRKPPEAAAQPELSREGCRIRLKRALDEVYPLVQPFGVAYPELKLRRMKSQWGNCHWAQGYITLNTALACCPEPLQRYVALHELVHFLHHDHGPDFRACMDVLMPQWKEYRLELKKYTGALCL